MGAYENDITKNSDDINSPAGAQQTREARLNNESNFGLVERVWDTFQQASPTGRGNECNDISTACNDVIRVNHLTKSLKMQK